MSFLGLLLSDELSKYITVWGSNVCVVVFDGVSDFKPKFLIEVDGIFIICLHVQVNLSDVLLGANV